MDITRLLRVSVLVAAGLVAGCQEATPEKPVRPVKVVRVGDPSALGGKRWFPGRARATQEVNLSFRVAGPLIAFPANVGDRVKKGQVLAQIDPRDFEVHVHAAESQVKKAEAQLTAMKTGARPEEIAQLEAALRKAKSDLQTAKVEYDREVKILRGGAGTASEVDRAARRLDSMKASFDQAQEALRIGQKGARKEEIDAKEAEIASLLATVRNAKHQLEDTNLRAPFTGEVAATYVENYQNVQAKEPVVRLLDTADIEMTIDVPETLMYLVPRAKHVVVRFGPLSAREFPAKIKEIGTEASRDTGTFPVTLILKQPGDAKGGGRILPGMTGEAQARGESPGEGTADFILPLTATFADPSSPKDKAFVWVFDPEKKTVSRRAVTVGQPNAGGVQVRGVRAGEWVVTAGVHHLEEGQRVEVLKEGGAPVSLTSFAVERPTIVWFATGLFTLAGVASYFALGQLEDPDFTVKTASVTTSYPGASPAEVEQEVTDRLEQAVQEMAELKNVSSISRAGLSILRVDIRDQVPSKQMPQVWDVLRKKISDARGSLPPGAGEPQVGDDFGAVYGFVLGITGDGYSDAELEKHAKDLKKELALVKGVARVELWGVQQQCVYVDVAEGRLAELGLRPDAITTTLKRQNMVVDAGAVNLLSLRPRFDVTGAFKSPHDIEDLTLEASVFDPVRKTAARSRPGELIFLKDVAKVRRGYAEPPKWKMRVDGEPALALAITHVAGSNIVELGQALDRRLAELMPQMPVGIELHRITWQSDLVSQSIKDFMVNLIEAVVIVLVVLWLTMGLRNAIIIGLGGLVLVILVTFVFMAAAKIDLHRISLGALIIAMGMMVDNAIVVVDNFGVKLRQGVDRKRAAVEAASQPSLPLLGATVAAVMAFYPIFASPMNTGEFAGSLFTVAGASLLFSWVLAVTVVPLMCMAFIPDPKAGAGGELYGGVFYGGFRRLLAAAIRFRVVFLAGMVGLLVAAVVGFTQVNVLFFPDSTRAQFMIDYWAPEGTRLEEVSARLRPIEDKVRQDPAVQSIATFFGQGPPRFYLPVDPEWPYPSYAQIIVNTKSAQGVKDAVARLQPWLDEVVPAGTMPRVRVYAVGPGNTWKFEARFSGPGTADPKTLLGVANQGVAILQASPLAKEVRTNWREPVWKIEVPYDEKRGRWVGVSREDVAASTRVAYDGMSVGLYREGDNFLPIVVRNTEAGRTNAGDLGLVQVRSGTANKSVPLAQVLRDGDKGITMREENPIIWRWDRRRAVTVQCSPNGATAPTLRASVLAQFEQVPLPPGYRLEWGGEYDSSKTSQVGLVPGIAPALALMALIIVALFNALRPPLIIVLTIPFAIIGITAGLLITGAPFGFMALLGAMSLSGMMIKNAIVLLDQIPQEVAAGKTPYQAVMDAAVSRLMPVVNAAATTVLGMAPLLQDVFWVGLAVTVMFGLAFGTVLTMIVVPVLYAMFYRIQPSPLAPAPAAPVPPALLPDGTR